MNRHTTYTILAVISLLVVVQPKAVPVKQNIGAANLDRPQNEEQNEEQQLQSLKALPNNVAITNSKTQTYTNINGNVEVHQVKEEKVEDAATGKTVAKISRDMVKTVKVGDDTPKQVTKTQVDIPSQGIHKITIDKKANSMLNSLVRDNNGDSGETVEDYYLPYEGVQYTPSDMAEYVRRTGDDEGVALAVEELMREGLMSRNEAVAYLEDVKNELDYLQDQYSNREQKPGKDAVTRHNSIYTGMQHQRTGTPSSDRRINPVPSGYRTLQTNGNLRNSVQNFTASYSALPSPIVKPTPSSGRTMPRVLQNSIDTYRGRLSGQRLRHNSKSDDEEEEEDEGEADDFNRNYGEGNNDDTNYNDMLERLRIADFLYKEYSLEEVIYQLAKEMFTQSIIRGNRDAEESLQRFSSFLQEETADGRISKELETKILDVVMAALMDAVGAQPPVKDDRQRIPQFSLSSSIGQNQRMLSNTISSTERGRKQDMKPLKNRLQAQQKANAKVQQTKNSINFDNPKNRKLFNSEQQPPKKVGKV